MISSKDEIQKRMLGSKQISPKNTKLASMANIANRSPTNKFQNKVPITNNTLSSKKTLLENSQRIAPKVVTANSPRKFTSGAEYQGAKTATYEQKIGSEREKFQAQGNNQLVSNSVPQQYEAKSRIISRDVPLQVSKKEGIITVNLPNGDIFTGDIQNGKYQGQGEYFFRAQNLAYRGTFANGKQHGQGVLINMATGDAIYEGTWEFGMKNGLGNYLYSSDEYYNGDWKNDEKNGNGFFAFRGGSYNGQWIKNRAGGRGNLKLADGTEFKGRFDNNEFLEGTVKYPNGDEYYGEMKNNLRNSEDSSYINLATKIRYKGGYLNDKKHGKGSIFYENGQELTGMFRQGMLSQNEVASYKWRDGTVFQGWFREGKPHKGTVTWPNGQKNQI